MMRIALAQINTTVGDLSGNSRKILDYVSLAKEQDADLVVFPELTITGYPPEDLLHKEYFVEDNRNALFSLVKMIENIVVIIGFVDSDRKRRIKKNPKSGIIPQPNLFNAAAVIFNRQIKGIYHKRDLPNYGVFDEKRYFREGQNNPLFLFQGWGVGVNICEDLWTENGIYQLQAKKGAKILINLSASPYHFGKIEQREKLLIHRAKENHVYVCYVNLVGGQDELVFDGGSLIVNPQGKILALGQQFKEDMILADIEINARRKSNSKSMIRLSSLQPRQEKKPLDTHLAKRLSQNETIYQALILGTSDYIRKNGFSKVVVGLSGGIDSSLVAVIATQALGKENVIGISMPSQFTSKETKMDARKLAENLGTKFLEIPIQSIFESYLSVLKGEFQGQKFNVAEENLQARIRGNVLMAFSNKFGWLVLTTGNKSEIAVGYCTLYGDMSGGFAVIKDVPKTKVYEIAKMINEQEGRVIPETVFARPPTAELRENQKDEDSLPPYPVLDPLLKAYVEEHKSLATMLKLNSSKELIKSIITMVDQSEYKRRQAPPGVKITPRAFGKDWRLPITNKYKEFNL